MSSPVELAARLSAVVATQQEVLAAITDVEKVLALVVERTPEMTSGSGAILEILEGNELVFRAGSGTAKDQIGKRLSLTSSLAGVAIQSKETVRCDNTAIDTRVDGNASRALGIASMIISPLMEGANAVGVLLSFSSLPNAFSDLDSYALQLLAGFTSAALMQARVFREQQTSEERYRTLFERNVAGVFRSTIDGRILDCNDALASYLGYPTREELIAQPAWNLYHRREDREEFLRMLHERAIMNIRMPFRRKDGSSLLGIVTASLIGSSDELLGTIVEA